MPLLPPRPGQLRCLGGATMGTSWTLRYVGDAEPAGLRDGIEAVLATVVAQMSAWQADSALSRFNAAPAGSWHALPAEFQTVLSCALEVAAASGGAFDPSLAPLVNLWGFGPAAVPDGLPVAGEVALGLGRPGLDDLRWDAARLLQPGGLALDFSGIAKGYAVDLVAQHLVERGLASFLVEIGGELRGQGMKPDGSPWWVGLEAVPGADPAGEDFVLALHGQSVATSGDYRRFFERDGQRYGHTLDPRTGWPVANAVASVTVVHPSCMHADAWATALHVLGPGEGLVLAEQQGLAALFVTREGPSLAEHMSPAFGAMLD